MISTRQDPLYQLSDQECARIEDCFPRRKGNRGFAQQIPSRKRYPVERFLIRPEQFRAVVTRYDKLADSACVANQLRTRHNVPPINCPRRGVPRSSPASTLSECFDGPWSQAPAFTTIHRKPMISMTTPQHAEKPIQSARFHFVNSHRERGSSFRWSNR